MKRADASQPSPVAGFADLRGASRLAIDAVAGITELVEDMHRNIAGLSPPVGRAPSGGAGGISGLVYRGVRGVTRAVGHGVDMALAQLAPLIGKTRSWPRREAVVAALNSVLGDYLAATNNPLAISMQVRRGGTALELNRAALSQAIPQASGKILLLVHGLCMNDLQWKRDGHDHGAALAAEFGYTPLYLHYNSGLHISTNGRAFAALMQQVQTAWPVPVEELVIVGHSMGGLVARSACHYAKQARADWLRKLQTLVFLGPPTTGHPWNAPATGSASWPASALTPRRSPGLPNCAAPASRTCATATSSTVTGRQSKNITHPTRASPWPCRRACAATRLPPPNAPKPDRTRHGCQAMAWCRSGAR